MWLERTPSAVVTAYVAMLPRLEAEESLLTANRISMGGGQLKPDVAARIERHWHDQITPRAETPAPRRPDPAALRALGFAVRKVRRPKRRKAS